MKKTTAKKAKKKLSPAIAAIAKRVRKIGWDEVSGGSAAKFADQFERWLGGDAKAFAAIREVHVKRPIGGLSARFFVELLPLLEDPSDVLEMLAAMITGDHRRWLGRPFDFALTRPMLSRRNKWNAIAAALDAILALLDHADPKVRANAAFLLAWLGSVHSARIIPALEKRTTDSDPFVRASAWLALAMHGATKVNGRDPDPRVDLCAAVASDDRERMEKALAPNSPIEWREFPWANGDLSMIALQFYLHHTKRERSVLLAQLDTDAAGMVMQDLLHDHLAEWPEVLDDGQRELLAAIVHHPKTHEMALQHLREIAFPFGSSNRTDQMIDAVRKKAGLPRPAPASGPQVQIEFDGLRQHAQHWWSDFAESGKPDPKRLAKAIVDGLSISDLADLLVNASDLEPDRWGTDGEATFDHPKPPGGTKRDGKIIFPGEGWPARARAYIADLQKDGWSLESEWWYGSMVEIIANRDADVLFVQFGNDWNQGKPKLEEAEVSFSRRWSLSRLVARAANRSALDAELIHRLRDAMKKTPGNRWIGHRIVDIANWIGTEPPEAMDDAAVWMQTFWGYVQGPFLQYARLLSPERRETLVLRAIAESKERVPQLYGVAPTPKVLEAMRKVVRSLLEIWNGSGWKPADIERAMSEWDRDLGERAKELRAFVR